jgi:FkbM family methyltransferase
MSLSLRVRRTLKQVLVQPQVNAAARAVLATPGLARLLPSDQVVRVPVVGKVPVALPGGKRFLMQTDGDDAIASMMFWRKRLVAYEPDTTELFLRLLGPARTFFDIGANTGLYALAAGTENPQRQVYAFEPFPAIYAYLARNLAVNELHNVQAYAVALGDFVGSIPFYIPSASAVFPFSASTAAGLSPQVEEIQVEATTLDQFAAEHRVAHVDLIKVDTETTEPQVLRGAQATLREHRPVIICEVLPFGKEPLLHAVLDPLDYRYFWVKAGRLLPRTTIVGDPTLANMNYLFVPQERVTADETIQRAMQAA